MNQSEAGASKNEEIPTAEWVVAGIGILLVCLALGFLTYKALFLDDGAPQLTFQVKKIVVQDGGSLVLASVSNTGGSTITDLQILASANGESHELEIDFLPARSSRNFGMFFRSSPESTGIEFAPGGYQEP